MTTPDDILNLFREMFAQETPEAAAAAALAWSLRHAPVDGGSLEIAGHRIERITPEPDPWPTAPLIVADWSEENGTKSGRSVLYIDAVGDYCPTIDDEVGIVRGTRDTLTNVVPVTVVPVAGLDELRACIKALGYDGIQTRGMPGSLLDTTIRLIEATDALGVDL